MLAYLPKWFLSLGLSGEGGGNINGMSEASWVEFRFFYGPVLMGWVR